MQAYPSAAGRESAAEIAAGAAWRSGAGVARPVAARSGASGRRGRPGGAAEGQQAGTVQLVDGAPVPVPHNRVAAVLRRAAFAVTCGCAAFAGISLGSLIA